VIVGRILYFDGHERSDVVAYRLEWAKRMMDYFKLCVMYDPDDVSRLRKHQQISNNMSL
jgi:hypothetical protein